MPTTAPAKEAPITDPIETVRLTESSNHANTSASTSPDGITPAIMSVIEIAATAFLGKRARIISVKQVSEPSEQPGRWVDSGLSLIHGSHNQVQRGH